MSLWQKHLLVRTCAATCLSMLFFCLDSAAQVSRPATPLTGTVEPSRGSYSLWTEGGAASLNTAQIAAEIDHKWLHPRDYGMPSIAGTAATGELGAAHAWTVTYSGGDDKPDLIYRLRVYASRPFADVQVTVRNGTKKSIAVQDIRPIEVTSIGAIDLGGADADDRVLSDSFSEDRPAMKIHDLGDAEGKMHRGVGSQLICNRKSGQSFFAGALTSDRFLSIFRIHLAAPDAAPAIGSFEADDAGTTELTRDYSLRQAAPEDQVELSVVLEPGRELQSERLLLSLDTSIQRQLETYGSVIRDLHHARVKSPTPIGWWSWTAYYESLDEDKALANAQWLAQRLKPMGYDFFHIDEGYSIARGDYLRPNAQRFPGGMEALEKKIAALGLVPAVWTAPFEVSERSWVYLNYPEWLVKNGEGKPIWLAGVTTRDHDRIYALDATHPGAQDYLRKTYSTMAQQWGIRYIKLDFMEDAAIEGEYYAKGTSALEAQRMGLSTIRSAVGDGVFLDKDGSEMLNPVGLVDMGRISQDTGHNFRALKAAATGIAARYYMNRNYFISDPDAFMVTAGDGDNRLSLDEARLSMALSAVSGGMLEIGNDLPGLESQPERLALIQNRELIEMARGGKASVPIDLMSYLPEDRQPSIFFLRKNDRESILTVFNWTDGDRKHSIALDTLGLKLDGSYKVESVWDGKELETCRRCPLSILGGPHSVQMLKITETRLPAAKGGAHAKQP